VEAGQASHPPCAAGGQNETRADCSDARMAPAPTSASGVCRRSGALGPAPDRSFSGRRGPQPSALSGLRERPPKRAMIRVQRLQPVGQRAAGRAAGSGGEPIDFVPSARRRTAGQGLPGGPGRRATDFSGRKTSCPHHEADDGFVRGGAGATLGRVGRRFGWVAAGRTGRGALRGRCRTPAGDADQLRGTSGSRLIAARPIPRS